MSNSVRIYKLEDLATFTRGVTFSKADQFPDGKGIGILRSHNVVYQDNKVSYDNIMYVNPDVRVKESQRLVKDDILISISNSKEQTGKLGICYSDSDFYAGGFMAIMRAKKQIHPYFLYLNLISQNFKYFVGTKNQGTTSIWNITFNRIKDFEISLPPLDEQEQIVALFQSLDTAVEKLDKQEENLRSLKRQLLRDLLSGDKTFGDYLKAEDFEVVNFGEIAEHISKRIQPAETDLDIYVGLEHLDPDSLRIERHGSPSDVKGTKLLIWKGDIIFGKRRAYQRKVAVSHFDGICSAHSMVLRAKNEHIDKDFLPFFMQSDEFMERAVQISEGSLSPTIKWKVLERQEFEIPKKKYQAQLTNVFKQFDKLLFEISQQKETLKTLKQQLLNEILG